MNTNINYNEIASAIADLFVTKNIKVKNFNFCAEKEEVFVKIFPEINSDLEYRPRKLIVSVETRESKSTELELVYVIGFDVNREAIKSRFYGHPFWILRNELLSPEKNQLFYIQKDASELSNYQEIMNSLRGIKNQIIFEE